MNKLFTPFPKQPIIWLALLATAVVVLFWPGTLGGFLLDDSVNIAPAKVESLSLDSMEYMLTNNVSGPTKRPISVLSFALNDYFLGPEPAGYKAVNILLHAITSSIVLIFLAHCLALTPAFQPREGPIQIFAPQTAWAALLGSALWALNPMQVSTVLYVVQRMTMLAALFGLLSILFYLRGRLALASANRRRYWRNLAGSAACLGLAVLSKENGLVALPIIAALEFTLLRTLTPRFPFHWGKRTAKLAQLTLAVLTVAAIVLAIQQAVPAYFGRDFSLQERLVSQVPILANYLVQLLLPYSHSLTFYYDDFKPVGLTSFEFLSAATFWVGLALALTFYRGQHSPALRWFVLLFLLGHSMESSFWPLELVFEHRNYLPSIGLFGVVAYGFQVSRRFTAKAGQPDSPIPRQAGLVVACFMLGFNILMLHNRVAQWADDRIFAHMMAEYRPTSIRANIELAELHMRDGNIQAGKVVLDRIEASHPNELGIPMMQLLVLCQTGELTESGLQTLIQHTAERKVSTLAIESLKELTNLLATGKCKSVYGERLLELTRTAMDNRNNVKRYYTVLIHAYNLYLHGRNQEAAEYFRRFLGMKVRESASQIFAHYHLGLTYLRLREVQGATEQLSAIQHIQGHGMARPEFDSLKRLLEASPVTDQTKH